ncbi:MAG: DUF3987 domain-containing protein [Flavobacteriia bacterium]|jgi:hypothetical protein
MKVSIFQDFIHPFEEQNLLSIFETIKSTKYQSEINSIRLAYHQEDKLLGDNLKKQLLAFTPSGTFSYRNAESLVEYNQIIHLDFDGIEYADLDEISKKINSCSYTYASFISPSGKGIKVFVKTDIESPNHQFAWLQLREYFYELIGLASDTKCKDICRLCFFSSDENLYLNESSEVFTPILEHKELEEQTIELAKSPKTLDFCSEFTNKKSEYFDGNRNSHVFLFASNANRFGIPEDETLNFLTSTFDLNQTEIRACVKSAYKNVADFAKFANIAKVAESEKTISTEKNINEDVLLHTPMLPSSMFQDLPEILQLGVDVFTEPREKDVFFISALAILSGCLPEVTGMYMQKTVYPNLYSFILAPAASGKGSMISAKELADMLHREILNQSLEEKKTYDKELREYKKRNMGAKAKGSDEEPPVEPVFKVLFIPANTSSAMIYKHLQDNGGSGIICETEADTLGAVFKNEWGSYSDLLRKAFHHERIALSRKTNKEYVEIDNPCISIALSGTPNQIFNIIADAEDGLFSRFIFYLFKTELKWISPAPSKTKINLTEHFKILSQKVMDMAHFLKQYPTYVNLSDEQWQKIDTLFENYLHDTDSLFGGDALSVVKRMGLIAYRVCLLLTALRKFENGDTTENLICLDADFEKSLIIVDVLMQHSLLMFNNLPKQNANHSIQTKTKKDKFFDELPQSFQRKQAIEIGLKFGISERTIDGLLKKWLNLKLQKEDTGLYTKI